MDVDDKAIQLIKKFEGFSAKPYLCPAGIPTIGYGETYGVTMDMPPITEDQAREMLMERLLEFEGAVTGFVQTPLTQNQFDALVCFVYNIGAGAFVKSTMLRKLNAKDYKGAANEFLRWNKANGVELLGLTARRKAERDLFLGVE